MNKNRRALLESLLVSILTCIAGMICTYTPLMIIFMFFMAIPLIILVRCYGVPYAVLSLALSTFTIMWFAGPVNTLLLILLPGVPALVSGMGMNRKLPVSMTLLAGFLATVLMYVLVFAFVQAMAGVPVRDVVRAGMQSAAEINAYTQSKIPGISQEEAQSALTATMEYAWMLVPAALILWSFAAALLNYFAASKVLEKTEKPITMLPPLREFRLPKNVLPGFLLVFVLTMIVTRLGMIDSQMITTNIMILAEFTFAAQGLAVVFFILHFYRAPKGFKILMILFVIIIRFMMIILTVIGIVDIMLDFRKRLVEHGKR